MNKDNRTEYEIESEKYLEKNNLFSLFQHLTEQLVVEKPIDPLGFILNLLEKPVSQTLILLAPPGWLENDTVESLEKGLGAKLINIQSQTEDQYGNKDYKLVNDQRPNQIIENNLGAIRQQDQHKLIVGYPISMFNVHFLRDNKIYPHKIFVVKGPHKEVIDRLAKKLTAQESNDLNEEQAFSRAEALVEEYTIHLKNIREVYNEVCIDIDSEDDLTSSNILDFVPKYSGPRRAMNLIVTGAPTSGRSKISKMIAESLKMVHVSVQCLLNDFVYENPGHEDTIQISNCFEEGKHVDDNLVNALFGKRINRVDARELGACIDGFPKNDAQIQFLKNKLKIEPTYIFLLESSETIIPEKSRIFDPLTGKKYLLSEAQQLGDYNLLNRITDLANEKHEVLQKRLDNWHLTRRVLEKHFGSKIIKIDTQKFTDEQVVEKISFYLNHKQVAPAGL